MLNTRLCFIFTLCIPVRSIHGKTDRQYVCKQTKMSVCHTMVKQKLRNANSNWQNISSTNKAQKHHARPGIFSHSPT